MSQGALPLGRLRPGLQPRGLLASLEVHTFVAFVDIKKAFDSCWVETTLVRLHDVGISSRLWHLLANFLCGTLSQVRLGDSAYQPWVDPGVAQGRVLSPLLLVDSLATSLRAAVPGVRLVDLDPCANSTRTTWSSLLNHRPTFSVLWTSRMSRDSIGGSRLVSAPPNLRLWSSVLSAAAQIVPCILGASLSLWCHSTDASVSLSLLLFPCGLTLTWSARGDRLSHQTCAWCRGEGPALSHLICLRHLRPFQFVIWSGVRRR